MIENGTCRFVSRKHQTLSVFRTLREALAQEVKARTAILDGELVVADPEGRTVFVSMMQRVAIVPFPGPPWFAMVSPCGRRTLCKCYAHSVCPCHPLWFLLQATPISNAFHRIPCMHPTPWPLLHSAVFRHLPCAIGFERYGGLREWLHTTDQRRSLYLGRLKHLLLSFPSPRVATHGQKVQ